MVEDGKRSIMVSADRKEAGSDDIPAADVQIITSGGRRIPAHSSVLAMASPVLESMLDLARKRGKPYKVIPIPGVPCDAVLAFLGFLYSSSWDARCRCASSSSSDALELDKFGMHLMVLSHVYKVKWLKAACEAELAARLNAEVVVDVLQLARLCDAPRLYLKCMRLVHKDLAAVEKTEAWRFLQDHDPWLELEILQFLHEADLRKKRRRRRRSMKMMEEEEQGVYLQLSEAMECLQHICSEGCTDVGPRQSSDGEVGPNNNKKKAPICPSYPTCRALQLLIRHLASCSRSTTNGRALCTRCRHIWNLLRLHSSICDLVSCCNVPLCSQFKLRKHEMEGKADDGRWKLLAKKVVAARVMSSLTKRRRLGSRSACRAMGGCGLEPSY